MSEILFIAHRIPFPPDRGDKIRSHHVLRRLADLAPVHVATLAEDEYDRAEEQALAAIAETYCLARRSKPLALAGLEALATGKPVSVTAFHSPALDAYVADVLASRPISAIYVFSGQMGQYVPAAFGGRIVMDFVDVDSAKFEAYGQNKSGPRGWIDAREGRELVREEARLAARADLSVLISDNERDLFVSRLPAGVKADVRTMGNGLDAVFFDPAAAGTARELAEMTGPKIVFTGQMDYAPNIEAAERALVKVTATLPPRKAEEARHAALLSWAYEPAAEVPVHMKPLREAAWEERAVEIAYTDREGAATRRRIWPLGIVYTDYSPWLLAWCCLRQDFRRFMVSRIAEVVPTSESFRPRRAPLLRDMLARLQGEERY